METPIIQVPRPPDDSAFSYRNRLNPKEYYEMLIYLACDEEIATWNEIKQWTSAWKKMNKTMDQILTMLERILKSRATRILVGEYWEIRNKVANDSDNILDKAIRAEKKRGGHATINKI